MFAYLSCISICTSAGIYANLQVWTLKGRYKCPSSRAANVVAVRTLVGKGREKKRGTQIYFRSRIFLFSLQRRPSPAIMLKAANRTIGLTCTFILRFFVISSRARSDHPFWRILSPTRESRGLRQLNKLCNIHYIFLEKFTREIYEFNLLPFITVTFSTCTSIWYRHQSFKYLVKSLVL